jgi:hypothetical protein
VMLRSADGVTNENFTSFTQIENSGGDQGTIAVAGPTGKNLWGTESPIFASNVRYLSMARHVDSQMTSVLPIYTIPFCENFSMSYKSASLLGGYLYLDGNLNTVNITPCSTFTTGTYYVDLICWMVKKIDVQNGLIKSVDA